MTGDDGELSKISSLRTIIDAATILVRELSDDAQLLRLLRVFTVMPAEDRETILAVLEREVNLRRMTVGSSPLTGWELRPNPNARLYGRAFGAADEERIAAMDVENMATAFRRLCHLATIVMQPAIVDLWREAVRRGYTSMTEEERAGYLRYAREIMTIIGSTET